MLGVVINHFWQQMCGKRNNFVTLSEEFMNFLVRFFFGVVNVLLTPADLQHLNSETETSGLVAAREAYVFSCISVIFLSPIFRYVPHI